PEADVREACAHAAPSSLRRRLPEMLREAQRQRHKRQRGIRPANGWVDAAAHDVQVSKAMHPAVGVNDAKGWVFGHAGCAKLIIRGQDQALMPGRTERGHPTAARIGKRAPK